MTTLGLGEALKEARIAKGHSLNSLARQLRWPPALLEAVEMEDWERIPKGQERPMVRQIAQHLAFDLDPWQDVWAELPGEPDQEPVDPRMARLERAVTILLAIGTLALVVWLVVPGPDLRSSRVPTVRHTHTSALPVPQKEPPTQAFAVLGEALPEAPHTEAGVLVTLRAMDVCHARILGEGAPLEQVLRVSEPWHLRVKGAFSLHLDNAGVVMVEVAGKAIRHGKGVGESWEGKFDQEGQWLLPAVPAPMPGASSPDNDPESEFEP